MVRHTGEDFIDIEGVAVASVFSLQSAGINSSKLDAPEPDRFAADIDASFSKKIFNVSVAEVESIIEPDGVGDDIGWESVTLIRIHPAILAIWAVNLAVPYSELCQ